MIPIAAPLPLLPLGIRFGDSRGASKLAHPGKAAPRIAPGASNTERGWFEPIPTPARMEIPKYSSPTSPAASQNSALHPGIPEAFPKELFPRIQSPPAQPFPRLFPRIQNSPAWPFPTLLPWIQSLPARPFLRVFPRIQSWDSLLEQELRRGSSRGGSP